MNTLSKDDETVIRFRLSGQESTAEMIKKLTEYDRTTGEHSQRVAERANNMAKNLNLSDSESFVTAALLHDIGKMFIPLSVLNKESELTTVERGVIDYHAFFGYQYLKANNFPEEVCLTVLLHHGITGPIKYILEHTDQKLLKKIECNVNLLKKCDKYDAMTSDRPYRKAMTPEEAFTILKETDDNIVSSVRMMFAVA